MNRQEAREKLMDYLYDEMEQSEKVRFEAYLAENPDLQKELEELKGARALLSEAAQDTPQARPFVMPDSISSDDSGKSARIHRLVKTGIAAAAVLLAGVLLLAYANLQAGISENGFYLMIGSAPIQQATEPAPAGITEEQVIGLLEQIREENTLIMAAVAEQSVQRQNEQLEEALTLLTAYYQEQRRQDLLLIAEGLSQLEEDTYYRFLRTDETIGDIIYALSNP
jgi:hypothetical protein